jgi:hypothetical protein
MAGAPGARPGGTGLAIAAELTRTHSGSIMMANRGVAAKK